VLDSEPTVDLSAWDHVAECSLSVPTGRIVIAGCTDFFPDAARIEIDAGDYRARVSCAGLESVSDDGLDGKDHYRVQLWKDSTIEPRVLKPRVS
jgi:hypothetical protein